MRILIILKIFGDLFHFVMSIFFSVIFNRFILAIKKFKNSIIDCLIAKMKSMILKIELFVIMFRFGKYS